MEQAIEEAFRQFSQWSGFTYERRQRGYANLRFTFHPQSQMYRGALGTGSRSGAVKINNTRDFKYDAKKSWKVAIPIVLVQHEVMHTFGRNHNNDRASVMHPDLPAKSMNGLDHRWLAYQFGSPPDPNSGKMTSEATNWFNAELDRFELSSIALARATARKANRRVSRKDIANAARRRRTQFFR